MTERVRIALIGRGAAARVFHEPVIGAVHGLEITRVVAHRTEDPEAAFADPDVDLVVITTPNDTHAPLTERALLAGKHAVVEKPFTTSSADARRLAALARERGLVLAIHHNRRWDGDFLTVRRLLDGGLLGRVVSFESRFDRFRDAPRPGNAWREQPVEGAGVLWDLGSHLVDQALVLFGPPEAITADVRLEREFAVVDDAFTIAFHYPRMVATLGSGMLVRSPGPRFAVRGTAGAYVTYGMDPQEDALKAGRTPAEAGWGELPPERWGSIELETAGLRIRGAVETLPGAYQAFYENVRDAIAGRVEIAVVPEEAAEVIRLLELARRSSEEARTLPV